MKNNRKQNILIILLTVLLMITMVGCGKNAAGNGLDTVESVDNSSAIVMEQTQDAIIETDDSEQTGETDADFVLLLPYTQNEDGTYECNGCTYQYRLEITGRMNAADKDSTFIYLSNLENITFDQAMKASGLSSNMDDYFDPAQAVLVEWK